MEHLSSAKYVSGYDSSMAILAFVISAELHSLKLMLLCVSLTKKYTKKKYN